MERYFVESSGKPVKSRTREPVGFPCEHFSHYGLDQLCASVEKIAGLHHATSPGPLSTKSIFIGWTQSAVDKAAKAHSAAKAKEWKLRPKQMAKRSVPFSEDVLEKQDDSGEGSPCGEYKVECGYIEEQWPDFAGDMSISIHRTSRDGVFKANFDFGIVEGIMILGHDEGLVDSLSRRRDGGIDGYIVNHEEEEEDDDDDDEIDSEDSDDGPLVAAGSKRKAKGPAKRGRPPKKAKTTKQSGSNKSQTSKFFVRLKSKDTSEGEISYTTQKGVIEFGANGASVGKVKGKGRGKKSGSGIGNLFSSLTGEISLCGIGSNIEFTARKVSDVASISHDNWEDYSERAYDMANASRWGKSSWW